MWEQSVGLWVPQEAGSVGLPAWPGCLAWQVCREGSAPVLVPGQADLQVPVLVE